MLEYDGGDRTAKVERIPPIAAKQSFEIAEILRADRRIKAECVAQLREVFGARIFTEHLHDGITGHNVDQSEDRREDQPDRGQRVGDALENFARHAWPARLGVLVGSGAASTGAADFRRSIFTRATRRRSISTTVKR